MDYWDEIEDCIEDVNIYDSVEEYLSDISSLPAKKKNLIVLHYLVSDVLNGGLLQYFVNSSGITAPEALEALDAIGQPHAKKLLFDAMAHFERVYPREQEARVHLFKNTYVMGGKDPSPFSSIDDQFFAFGEYGEDMWAWLDTYAVN
jgi:hypothetical protein